MNPANLSWFEGLLGVGRLYKKEVERRKSKDLTMRTLSQKQGPNGHVGQARQPAGAESAPQAPAHNGEARLGINDYAEGDTRI